MWITALLVLALVPVALWFFQSAMIYLPRRYEPEELQGRPRLTQIPFTTDQGSQTAFYVAPATQGPPTVVWMFCAGNADRAISWANFGATLPDPTHAALLVDYPGYGACEGTPTPATILANTRAAVAALAQHLDLPDLKARMAVYGHSLGAAAVLQYAAVEGAQRVVLIAPFTTMMAMARRKVGWPLCLLLRHPFDNEACVRVLRERGTPVLVVHGSNDQVIPVAMGRRLADLAGGTFIEVPGADHVEIADEAETEVYAFMRGEAISGVHARPPVAALSNLSLAPRP